MYKILKMMHDKINNQINKITKEKGEKEGEV